MIILFAFIGLVVVYQGSQPCSDKCFKEKVSPLTKEVQPGFNGAQRDQEMNEQAARFKK